MKRKNNPKRFFVGGSIPPLGAMTNLQFIKAIQQALSDNENGDKASIMNAIDLVELFRKEIIKDYLKTKSDDHTSNDTETKR